MTSQSPQEPVAEPAPASQLHVIVQAGGRGSRLRHHTWNKPKCLVSVRGKPLLYHFFDRFKAARFIIIGDYAFEQLEAYLQVNPPGVAYELVQAEGKGTSSGIAVALARVPEDAPLLLSWSDLIIGQLPAWPASTVPVVCTTSAFTCRWSADPDGRLHEKTAHTGGIPGVFYFSQARMLPAPPAKGEFVKWFSTAISHYALLDCADLEELGDFASIEDSNDRAGFCRHFNEVDIQATEVTKRVIDHHYDDVHRNEVAWYAEAARLGFRRIPKIHATHPLKMDRIQGQHAYLMRDLSPREGRAVIANYLDTLTSLHDCGQSVAMASDIDDVYCKKTLQRVNSVAAIIPGFNAPSMTINGKKCRNIFAEKYSGLLPSITQTLMPDHFVPIHGDATFSNTLVDDNLRVWFIDPRGYFSKPGIMGDPWYDFAKVYYSAVGGYDGFNRRKFKLHIDQETVEILMEEPALSKTAQTIFSHYFGRDMHRIKIIHGLIWLSLAGYVKDDLDSIVAAFYNGLYWLESGLESA